MRESIDILCNYMTRAEDLHELHARLSGTAVRVNVTSFLLLMAVLLVAINLAQQTDSENRQAPCHCKA